MNTLPINTGDTAFMILCTAMVCLMTPGLAFFYGGLARKNNILTIMSQSFLSVGITTIMWVFGGFGLAFGRDIGGVIGNPADFFDETCYKLPQHVSWCNDSIFNVLSLPTDVYRDYRSFDDRSFCREIEFKRLYYTCYFLESADLFPCLPLDMGWRIFGSDGI